MIYLSQCGKCHLLLCIGEKVDDVDFILYRAGRKNPTTVWDKHLQKCFGKSNYDDKHTLENCFRVRGNKVVQNRKVTII